jgi:hypothetical protein
MKTLLLAFLLVPAPFQQSTTTLHYDIATSPAVVSTYTQRITVNGTVLTAAPVCGPEGTGTTCFIPVTLNPTNNDVRVAFINAEGETEMRITGLDLNGLPVGPTNPRARITITINIGGN